MKAITPKRYLIFFSSPILILLCIIYIQKMQINNLLENIDFLIFDNFQNQCGTCFEITAKLGGFFI